MFLGEWMNQRVNESTENTNEQDASTDEQGSQPGPPLCSDAEVVMYRPFDQFPLKWDPVPERE